MRKRRWTETDDRIVRVGTTPDAAKFLGRTINAVYQRRRWLGIRQRRRPKDITGTVIGELTAVRPVRIVGRLWVWEWTCALGHVCLHAKNNLPVGRCPECFHAAVQWRREQCERDRVLLHRPWTEIDDQVVRAVPCREAARALGRTLLAVQQRRYRLGLRGLTPKLPKIPQKCS